ncbi:hypothetical protein HGA88_01660 [Candidatus Roizmanbacteria bacterium]|nr:hypothetical protein [Candidatus Roizmanbacteria bacterium]
MIHVSAPSRYKVNKKLIRQIGDEYLVARNTPGVTVNVVFVGKRKMREIASTYKNEDVALPVLAFTFKEKIENESLLGEVILCYPQSVLLAAERNKDVDTMLRQLIEHGINNLLL